MFKSKAILYLLPNQIARRLARANLLVITPHAYQPILLARYVKTGAPMHIHKITSCLTTYSNSIDAILIS